MNLVAYDKKKLDNPYSYKRAKWLKMIDEFVESDMDCAKVKDFTHKSATSCTAALNTAIRRYHKDGIRAIERKGEVFLIKIDPVKD